MAQPPLKWAGGKRWLVNRHRWLFPETVESLIEPFLGSGAVFFALQPAKALLSDKNADLIQFYRVLKEKPLAIQELMKAHQARHSKEHYYRVRSYSPLDEIERAARFLYLNRSCFNGIYRVNRNGYFNVPKGTKERVYFEEENFELYSLILKSASLCVCGFGDSIKKSKEGDFLFVDPPYTVKHNNNGFVKYNEILFAWKDQVQLKHDLLRAAERGVKILMTNAYHESILDLYEDIGVLHELGRESVIGGGNQYRSLTSECVIQIGYSTQPHSAELPHLSTEDLRI